ncbi:conjugative transposon protein TraM [Mariniphaga sediminis]|uniref:conjugative transposon protein TraM n=1 Tax=Mariniphaga sediminis TaxID=1628158 RepID=UPI00356A2B54
MKTILKKSKAMFILPLILLPFVVLIFYILGGGNPTGSEGQNNAKNEGVNYSMPQAESTIEITDKMEAYEQQGGRASTTDYHILEIPDSLQQPNEVLGLPEDLAESTGSDTKKQLNGSISHNLLAHIKQKEQEINRELDPPEWETDKVKTGSKTSVKKQISRVQNNENKNGKGQSAVTLQRTGIQELDKVFEENIDLNRQNDSLKYTLRQLQQQQMEEERKENARFALEKKNSSGFQKNATNNLLIKAEIYETTTVLDGHRVKLRLLEDTWLNDKKIPENTFVYGICKVRNERLHITISQLPVENAFLPVDLAIHDLDGLSGLYVPGYAARKITREVGSQTNTSSLFGMTDSPLTYAGIRAADRTTQAFLKRVRLKKVTVKKNTLVYLINQNQ